MVLLVTRAHNDASELIASLEKAGHEVIHQPLLDIVFFDHVTLPPVPPQAVLITSANGARGLARLAGSENLKSALAITVGPASEKAALDAGFAKTVQSERGDVTGVIEYVQKNLSPQDGPVLYASGVKTRGNLVEQLTASGFEVDHLALYEAQRATTLSPAVLTALQANQLDGVTLFSPRTAKIWISAVERCKLTHKLPGLKHFCLSHNVANVIKDGLGKNCDITICKKPDTKSMLAAIASV